MLNNVNDKAQFKPQFINMAGKETMLKRTMRQVLALFYRGCNLVLLMKVQQINPHLSSKSTIIFNQTKAFTFK